MLDASVVICTRDRWRSLSRTLDSIEQSARRAGRAGLEVIVVDDGSKDDTAEAVRRFAARAADLRVRLLRQPGRGLSSARNLGVRHAAGQLLIFIDDDCVVSPRYLREVLECFAGDTRPFLRGGRVELGDPHDAPLTIKTSACTERMTRGDDPAGFLLGCNMAMARQVAETVGPFDERFGAGSPLRSAEDTDFILRAFLAGIPVEYAGRGMVVFHHHGRRAEPEIRNLHRAYNIGNGALMMKHLSRAPWLVRRNYWNLRNAVRELAGGPHFDARLGLSHGPMVWHTLIGAALFAGLKVQRRPWRSGGDWRRAAAAAVRRTGRPEPGAVRAKAGDAFR